MNRILLLGSILGLSGFFPAQAAAPPDPLVQWIKDLGASDFQTREQATKALLQAGKPALARLEQEQAAAADPEIRRRLEQITATIRSLHPPLELVLELSERPVILGVTDTIPASLTFINRSDKPITIIQPADGCMHRRTLPKYLFELRTADGHNVPRMPWFGCGTFNGLRAEDFITLQPGDKAEVLERPVAWARLYVSYFKVVDAGSYTVNAIYEANFPFDLKDLPPAQDDNSVDGILRRVHQTTIASKPVKLEVIVPPPADQLLRKLEKHEHHDISRPDALHALGKSQDLRAVSVLLENLKEKDAALRRGAVNGLQFFKQKRVVDALIPILSDPDDTLRYRAFDVLRTITGVNDIGYQENSAQRWQDWWKLNRDQFKD